jgi:hypothetical protein
MDYALEARAERRRSTGSSGRPYADDPRLQRIAKLRKELADKRAEIERCLRPRSHPVLGEDEPKRPGVLRRDCGTIVAVR